MKKLLFIFLMLNILNINSCDSGKNQEPQKSKENEVLEILMLPHGVYETQDKQLQDKIITSIDDYHITLKNNFNRFKNIDKLKAFKIVSLFSGGYLFGNKEKILNSLNEFYSYFEEYDKKNEDFKMRIGFLSTIGGINIKRGVDLCFSELNKENGGANWRMCLYYLSKVYEGNYKETKKIEKLLHKKNYYNNSKVKKEFEKWFVKK